MAFEGFPAEAFSFYRRLEADNSRAFWDAHKDDYQRLADLLARHGDLGELRARADADNEDVVRRQLDARRAREHAHAAL